jgi:hypothetical protein
VRKRIGQRLAHRHPNHRYAGGKRKSVRKGKTGTDAGEAPWPDSHRDQIKGRGSSPGLGQNIACQHREQCCVSLGRLNLAKR